MPWVQALLDVEEGAAVLRNWEPLVVPGLLQTEGYARAILRAARPGESDDEVERLVVTRMARQQIWERQEPAPPMLFAVLGEAVLRQQVAPPEVMCEQLRRLLEAAGSPRITVQIMPFDTAAHPGMLGSFLVASFDNGPDAAYLDNALDGQVSERRKDVARISLLFDTLRSEALTPGASSGFIARMVEQWT